MKFQVQSSELQKALAKTINVVPTRSTLPILENLLFEVHSNNLKITATDLEISVAVSIQIKGNENGTIAIPAKRIFDTVRALPDTPISFSVDTESNKIKMKTENGEYTLIGETTDVFPSIPEFKGETEFVTAAPLLQQIIDKTTFAVSTDELRPSMMGVLFQIGENKLVAVSTDGHRLVKIINKNFSSKKISKEVIIPAKALNLIGKVAEGAETKISINETHIVFKYEGVSLISRLIEEKYPNFDTVIPQNNNKYLIVNKYEILQSVRRVSLYSNSTTHQIRMSLMKDEVKITAEDQDFGSEAKETISCDYNDEEMEIGFNSAYILDILTHIDGDEIQFNLSSSNKASIVVPRVQKEGEEMLMLVMPVRLNN
ncbi:MAG: DNA polymerase III subunit beta [Bacteroidetes bacterium]|nr:DNA polymerase III subunit beta [Bacteroidota bacterium]